MFNLLQALQASIFGPLFRSVGQRTYNAGVRLAGSSNTSAVLTPNLQGLSWKGNSPSFVQCRFVGTNVQASGNVLARPDSQLYFGVLLKAVGDDSSIEVGREALVMDQVVALADNGHSITIGSKAVVSSKAYLHNCSIGNNAFIGANAKVSSGCVVEDFGGVAAGSFLEPGTVVKAHEYWAGAPAKFLRKMNDDEKEFVTELKENYDELGFIYDEQTTEDIYDKRRVQASNKFPVCLEYGRPEEEMDDTEIEQAESEKMPLTPLDKFLEPIREEMQWLADTNTLNEPREMLYDGPKEKFPAYLNERNQTNRLANDLKRRLESDVATQTMDTEIFEQKNVQLIDKEFKRKY